MELLIIYIVMAYGLTVLLVEGLGPFDILEKMRLAVSSISEPLGKMFDCFLCTSTNIGWAVVLVENIFDCHITPVSILLSGTNWFVICCVNMFFTCGAVWIIKNVVSLLEKKTEVITKREEEGSYDN